MTNKEIIVKYLKENRNMNDVRCQQEYEHLHIYQDIENEFVAYIQNGWQENGLSVEGYTAKYLNDQYPLSPVGAYNYLVSLREKPDLALDYLKKGLPRR